MYEHLDEDKLAILRRGTAVWNAWRAEHPGDSVRLDGTSLRGLDLSGADLRGATFQGTDLSKMKLVGTNLSGAKLTGSQICWSDLSGADLREADCLRADMRFSSFADANLEKAWLWKTRVGASGFIRSKMRGARLDECDASVEEYGRTSFRGADLRDAVCREADLSQAVFQGADLRGASFHKADLASADLTGTNAAGADFTKTDLSYAQFDDASLSGARLEGANLTRCSLVGVDLTAAVLHNAIMVQTDLTRATLVGCGVYGVAVWDITLTGATQVDLIIKPPDDRGSVTIDNLEVAQFVYLLLYNEKIRSVIDTITSKAVLILGRFTPERKPVLDQLRSALRARNYLPMLFDFEKPDSRDLTETVATLAHMARFIVADLTDAKSLPQELMAIVPNLPSVPVQPLILTAQREYAMFEHFRRYPWVLAPYEYTDLTSLLAALDEHVIAPADEMAARSRRAITPPGAPPGQRPDLPHRNAPATG